MNKTSGSPKAAKPIPMGNKKHKLESSHDTKIGPEKTGKKTMPGPKSTAHGVANGKGHSKPPARHYPPGDKPAVSKYGFLINKSTYK